MRVSPPWALLRRACSAKVKVEGRKTGDADRFCATLACMIRRVYKDKTLQIMAGAIDTIFFAAVTIVSVVVKTV